MPAPRRARPVVGALVALVAAVGGGGVAHADPAEPTDYRTVVVSITPPTDTIDVEIIGGDSFVELTAARGTEVLVEGYQGEPYLRFGADGTVEQNDRSPTLYQNATRDGGSEAPAGASADLPPAWSTVADDGTYAWHDHRTHWMQRGRPPGASPGDRILEATIPLVVDGTAVEVAVASDWLPEPSPTAVVAGAAIGAVLVLLALATRRRIAWALLVVAGAAVGIGWWQYSSLPAVTGPLLVWWVLPVVAAGSALAGLIIGRRPLGHALVVLGALELGIWVYIRREGALRAIIPTDAPFWLDRGVMAASVVVASAALVSGLVGLFRLPAR